MKKSVIALCIVFLTIQSPLSQAQGSQAQGSQTQPQASAQNFASGQAGSAQNTSALPLRRIALFSSGVGFYEHSGTASGTLTSPLSFVLPFNHNTINDALMSLIINDPVSDNPSVQYASANTLYQSLGSLSVNLLGNPGIADILNMLRGEEIEVYAPSRTRGRIIGVEYRNRNINFDRGMASNDDAWLTLLTPQGLRPISLNDITSFSFANEDINADFHRSLDLLTQSRNQNNINLYITLPGAGSRNVTLSYVIPTPVWKVSYRLDLGTGAGSSLFQGWAIIDNDSDNDWDNVELSLVTGRPVSFIQNLYSPYHTSRPQLPLSIAGIAEARTYESGSRTYGSPEMEAMEYSADSMMLMRDRAMPSAAFSEQAARTQNLAGGNVQTAEGAMAGDQFEFTLRRPVSLARHHSAMFPLVEAQLRAEKVLVFQGSRAVQGRNTNPAISVELTNDSGLSLPAGPITVYDAGNYAGDALIEFFPENEKRLISYGDDLTVTGTINTSNTRTVTAVTVSGGVMTITRRQDFTREYSFRNASSTNKNLIIEHPITHNASLGTPAAYDERTPDLYRFRIMLQANQEQNFTVREEMPVSERITLAQMRPETFLSYSTSQEIPANVRSALTQAIELRRIVDQTVLAQQEAESQRTRLVTEQDRIRRNIEAVGNQSPQGQEYLSRLLSLDRDIDAINTTINNAVAAVQTARRQYDDYLANLNLR